MNSPPCPSTRSLRITKLHRPLRIFSMNSPCTAIAPSKTTQTPVPYPLPTPRPLRSRSAVEASSGLFIDTRLEADLPDLLWSFVNLFHRKAERIGRDLDDNETAQRRSHAEQDGSEIRSVELERLIAQGLTLIERRNAFEFFRDHLASSTRPRPAPPGVRVPVRRSITAP